LDWIGLDLDLDLIFSIGGWILIFVLAFGFVNGICFGIEIWFWIWIFAFDLVLDLDLE
jgi:hypothetical protein